MQNYVDKYIAPAPHGDEYTSICGIPLAVKNLIQFIYIWANSIILLQHLEDKILA